MRHARDISKTEEIAEKPRCPQRRLSIKLHSQEKRQFENFIPILSSFFRPPKMGKITEKL